MNNNKTFVISPYIFFKNENEDNVLVNDILNKRQFCISDKAIAIMKACENSTDHKDLVNEFTAEDVQYAIDNELILEKTSMWNRSGFKKVEIEINTDCNYRCEYCPVRKDPKKRKIMSMELYKNILYKVIDYGKIDTVSFSLYNEPTLDPFFKERLKLLKDNNLKLILHSNGSNLTKEYVDYLYDLDILEIVFFNFPNLDEDKFESITESRLYKKALANIEYAIDKGLNVDFSIQKVGEDYRDNLSRMNELFSDRIKKKIVAWATIDRAGILDNQYYQNIKNGGALYGCNHFSEWLLVDVDGNCLSCVNDFYEKNIYGSLVNNSIDEVVASEEYASLIKKVFTGEGAGDDFLCRSCYEMKLMGYYYKSSVNLKNKLFNK